MNNQFYTEAYFGGSEILSQCEVILGQMIDIIRTNRAIDINRTPQNKELQKLLMKQFGFKKVNIYWSNSLITNAVTFVNSHAFGYKIGMSEKVNHKNGLYDTTHSIKLDMIVTSGIILKTPDITPRMLLAIMLHEIGHNFDFTFYTFLGFIFDLIETDAGNITTEILSSELFKDIPFILVTLPDRIVNKFPKIKMFFGNISKFTSKVSDYLNMIVSPVTYPISMLTYIILSPIASILKFIPRKKEEYADSVAVAYGYGSDLADAFDFIINGYKTDIRTATRDSKFLNILYDIGLCNTTIMFAMSGHASNQQRVLKMMNKLKADIDSSEYPPEVRDDLLEEYEKIKASYERMVKKTEDERLVITKTMLSVSHELLKGYDDLQYNILKMNAV